jgi:hypothetical protein
MSFWNGTSWSDAPVPPSESPRSARRLRDWIATAAMVGVLVAYLIPVATSQARGVALTLSPSRGTAGTKVGVVGRAFPARTSITLAWDGSSSGMPAVTSNGGGWFRMSFVVPKSNAGAHTVSVSALGAVVTSSSFTVDSGVTPVATPAPTATPVATPAPTATSAPTPAPTPTPALKTVGVYSVPALLSALADTTVDEIVVANGTYHVSPAASAQSDSLWIGSRFAGRTRPVTVRAATRGGVTFDGGGATYYGCLSFEDGAHDQTWDGFNCAGGQATSTGIVMFGGYAGLAAPHHITMRNITILPSCTGRATSASGPVTDHAFYLSEAVGGPHDLLFEDITVHGAGYLASAFHLYHSDSANRNAWNVTVRRLHVSGTQQAVMLWDPTLRNITFDTADITNALRIGVRYETIGASGIVLENITTTGSGSDGFYSSQGPAPAGVTLLNNLFD